MSEWLDQARSGELIEAADHYLARHLLALEPEATGKLELLIALASAGIRRGHVCLSLEDDPLLQELDIRFAPQELERYSIVGRPGDQEAPLILEDGRLYLARYHAWEQQIIRFLQRRLEQSARAVDGDRLRRGLKELFDECDGVNWQRLAAVLAVTRSFCVISGGPGTGKTWTVARILQLLLDQPGGDGLRIGLAAPTGKAAARMTESIGDADPALLERLEPAQTLHRLLGMRPGRVRAGYHAGHPLPLDLLIVDEMSMVDLPMMARLLEAVPDQARLILLGDRHQLASVEAGQVMADLCGSGGLAWSVGLADEIHAITGDRLPTGEGLPAMADHLVELRDSRRFERDKGIGRLAVAVNAGDCEATHRALEEGGDEVAWHSASPDTLQRLLRDEVVPLYREIRETGDPRQAIRKMERIRVLCAVREGPQGVRRLNALVERALGAESRDFYHGQPVMVSVNDQARRLFNGDIGLVLDNGAGKLQVFFQERDGLRAIPPSQLPPHETVYAMTIHKSQGSEFDRVILVLPDEESPVATRELLYTGITRARKQVLLCASQVSVNRAIARRVRRVSGLYRALWGDGRR